MSDFLFLFMILIYFSLNECVPIQVVFFLLCRRLSRFVTHINRNKEQIFTCDAQIRHIIEKKWVSIQHSVFFISLLFYSFISKKIHEGVRVSCAGDIAWNQWFVLEIECAMKTKPIYHLYGVKSECVCVCLVLMTTLMQTHTEWAILFRGFR